MDVDRARSEALALAVELHACDRDRDHRDQIDCVLETAGEFTRWLTARAVRIRVGKPVITEQGHPARHFPLHRTGADMAVTIKDSQIATYPAPEADDSKGFAVSDTITVSEDSNGAVVSLVSNPDGTAAFTAVAPGAAQVTWTDGTISFSDTINVTPGDAATIVVGEPTITDQ